MPKYLDPELWLSACRLFPVDTGPEVFRNRPPLPGLYPGIAGEGRIGVSRGVRMPPGESE
jgi:hypothetical protein